MFENFVQYDLYLGEIAGNKSTLFTSVQRVHTHAQKYLWRLRNFAKKHYNNKQTNITADDFSYLRSR